MLRLTAEQVRAHQERVHGRSERARNDPQPAQATHAAPDRWPLVLLDQIVAAGLPEPYREFTWHHQRNWRLDLAWPEMWPQRAVEVDGMVHRIKGRFLADVERHNAMMFAGWRWVRVTPAMVKDGSALELVRELLT
jgi:hypothetical protein